MMPAHPFALDLPRSLPSRAATWVARPLLERMLGLTACGRRYRMLDRADQRAFPAAVLAALGIEVRTVPASLAGMPARGPLLVAANHPHGALDGLALAVALADVRSDVRLLVNFVLARVDELRATCFFVDPFEGPGATRRSLAGLRSARRWLDGGGALVVFPAGEVAHRVTSAGAVLEAEWSPTIGRLALATSAQVVPALIEGRNSRLFYAAGRLHPRLRTALLARELLARQGSSVSIAFGAPIDFGPRGGGRDRARQATERIRAAVLRGSRQRHAPSALQPPVTKSNAIRREIAGLPDRSRLLTVGRLDVIVAAAADIPITLREIGRLRAQAYREVGEGTRAEIDIDRFDGHYWHLFCWDRREGRIAGAYRIGRVDRIVTEAGVGGLYTRTLFRYDARLLDRLSPALELGRSFVRAEYQRRSNALALLWKGIGRLVTRHADYRVLFGPVSISARYSDRSQALLMAFLRERCLERSLAQLVEATSSPGAIPLPPSLSMPHTLDEAGRQIAALEHDGKGMPVLLRQYLKLDARLIAFNRDPDFGEALDALMMVDLTKVKRAILNRYLGQSEAAGYLARHGRDERSPLVAA